MTKTMRRWEMEAVGRERLSLVERPIPNPGSGEVLVKVSAVSLNYRDKMVIETGMGLDLTFPFTPGSDLAGQVMALGEGVTRFGEGDRVISTFAPGWLDGGIQGSGRNPARGTLGGLYPGVLADYVCFPEDWFVAAPETLDDRDASTLPCAGLTAWFALVERGRVRAGQTVVVQGTGGVALFGLQIAKAQGAEVIITSASADKLARAKTLGADHGVNRLEADWAEAVLDITDGRGADQILELAGGENLRHSLTAVAPNGHIAVIGLLNGVEISTPVVPLLLKSPTIQGIAVGHRRGLDDLVRAVDRTGIKPVVDATYALEALSEGLDHLDQGPFGKLVIQMI
ncbi:zinc-dependent alcohol dehydrogenase family protein [Rhodospirillum sp. A1_3_36]|uniref:zinc-dependent alcohol dehydrogenase family protein n=1 Tax=Rhodospirillum sp. A1_3_36 TaxID=3391666 RepID=UPI0039A73C84